MLAIFFVVTATTIAFIYFFGHLIAFAAKI